MSLASAKLFHVQLVLYSAVCPFEIKEICHVHSSTSSMLRLYVCVCVCVHSFVIGRMCPFATLFLLAHTCAPVCVCEVVCGL